MNPFLRTGFGRLSKTGKLDFLRDNWWCVIPDNPNEPTDSAEPPISKAQLARGGTEYSSLVEAAKSGPNYIAAEAVRWAKARPSDPDVPEALARAVTATHYNSCISPDTGAFSKQAFDFLKQRYPDTSWARETKYWYK